MPALMKGTPKSKAPTPTKVIVSPNSPTNRLDLDPPRPWLGSTIYFREPVKVAQANDVFISVGILLFMVLAVIFSIMASGWKMSRALGVGMFGLYLVYVGQEILRAALANRFGGC